MKINLMVIVLVLLPLAPLLAGGAPDLSGLTEPATGAGPVSLDGVISEGEYAHRAEHQGMQMYYTWAEGVVSIGLRAPTEGWISIGLGSGRMDGAHMLFAFVRDGQAVFEEHLGRGRSHSPAVESLALGHAVALVSGENPLVTLEVQVPEALVSRATGQDGGHPYILAFGPAANFTAYHSWRTSALLTRP